MWQKVECNDRVLTYCEGVPEGSHASRKFLAIALGWAYRRFNECADKQAEALKCIADHNAKADEHNRKAKESPR